MSTPVFLVPGSSLDRVGPGAAVVLDGPEGRHAVAVRRIRVGERVVLSDGRGRAVDCVVTTVGKDSLACVVEVARAVQPPDVSITVVQAVPKGDRGELAVELMTEAGVDDIVPWAAARCVARWDGDKATRGVAKWTATAREAAKQSRRVWLPRIHPLASTREVLELIRAAELCVVLHESATRAISDLVLPTSGVVVVVVGPEGGLADEELATFSAQPVRLGPEVVRTSTAGALAAGVLLSRTARWQPPAGPA